MTWSRRIVFAYGKNGPLYKQASFFNLNDKHYVLPPLCLLLSLCMYSITFSKWSQVHEYMFKLIFILFGYANGSIIKAKSTIFVYLHFGKHACWIHSWLIYIIELIWFIHKMTCKCILETSATITSSTGINFDVFDFCF